ncbi:MAG: endonuclease domain-containing protein [Bacteroidota bacterium]|jgi:very-short-patch-repair endonuclease
MAKVFNRTSEKGRRKQLQKAMPDAEVILWSRLKNRQITGTRFRRQYSIGKYIVDFYCAEKKLAIELDGESHFVEGAHEKDVARQKWIEQFGIRFLRFTNDDIRKNLYGVLDAIEEAIRGVDSSVPMNDIHRDTSPRQGEEKDNRQITSYK